MNLSRTAVPTAAPDAVDADESWISKTPGVCGGQACIRNTRITVWGLESLRRFGLSDEEIMADIEGLTREDLAAAWEYAATHPDEVEAAILRNDEEA
jgi:uncharacterized protein (DUF433 family)